jgi:hypothetical protein
MQTSDVYAVERIIAKSLRKGYGPNGYEYQYLVRWAGYGPKDDTWEMYSNVLEGAEELVEEYEARGESYSASLVHLSKLRRGARTDVLEQPITVLDRDKNRRYLVSFCGSARSRSVDYSPLAEKEWMKPIDVSIKARIPQSSVKKAIREWEVSQIPTPPRTPLSRSKSYSESSTNSRAGGASTAPDGWKRYTGMYIWLLFSSGLKLIR